MKTLFILLISFISVAAQAQTSTGFPVVVSDKVTTSDDYNTRSTRRGEVQNLTVSQTKVFNGDMATTGLSIGSLQKPLGGRAFRIKALSISSSVLAQVRILMGSFAFGANPISYTDHWVGPNMDLVLPVDETIRNSQQMPALYVRQVWEASPWKYAAQVAPASLIINKGQTTTALNNASNSYTYTLSVTNNSGAATSGTITVTDSLPEGVKVTGASGSGWVITTGTRGRSLVATTSGSIANGATSGTITVTLTPQISGNYILSALGEWVPNDRPRRQDIVWVGNSIDNGSASSSYATAYPQLVADWLRDTKGLDAEILNLSIPGITSSDHEFLRKKEQRYNFEREPYAIFYQQNVNDVLSGIPTATSQANLAALINHKKKFYPNAYLFILAAVPHGDATTEAGLVTLRSALQTTVSANGDSKTYYVPGTAASWPASSNATKLAADKTHPTDSGHADIATQVINALSAILP